AGWYGGLGVEAMALGKPVIAYLREGDFGFVDPGFRAELPVTSATPASIADVMRRFITMPRGELHALGQRSRAFVEHWHDPRVVAAKTLADYQGANVEPGS
ncbi:glycosyltransferase, partial [Streptococcus suis]